MWGEGSPNTVQCVIWGVKNNEKEALHSLIYEPYALNIPGHE